MATWKGQHRRKRSGVMPTRFFSVVQKAAKALRASNALAVIGKRQEPQFASRTFTKGQPKTGTSRGSRVFAARRWGRGQKSGFASLLCAARLAGLRLGIS